MKKVLLLIVILLVTLYSCSKKKDDNQLKYTVVRPSDIHISQYRDTIIAVPISPQYTSGVSEPVSITFGNHPAWALFTTTSSASVTPDSIAIFPIRFHPYDAGNYPLAFNTKSSYGDMQSYSVNVVVDAAPSCSAYLIGSYNKVVIYDPRYLASSFTSITAGGNQDSVKIGFLSANINCMEKGINIPMQHTSRHTDYSGSGTFKNDTISFRIMRWNAGTLDIDASVDTCDMLLIRQ